MILNSSEAAKAIALNLLQINAIKLSPQNPFTWASGIKSPIYCDNRILLSYPKVRNLVKNTFVESIAKLDKPDIIVGVATAGIPHGALVADLMDLPFIYVRDKPKSHGRQNQIEGEYKAGQKAVVIEDLISTGGSSIKAVEALQAEGVEVQNVTAIFSYQFKSAVVNFEQAKCPFYTLTNYDTLIDVALENNLITEEQLEILKNWRINVNL